MIEVIESNVDMILIGKYTNLKFEDLLELYRRNNTPSYPGATSIKIVSGHISAWKKVIILKLKETNLEKFIFKRFVI